MQNERVHRNLAEIHARIDRTVHTKGIGQICEIHYHDEIELLHITDGALSCQMDSGNVTVRKGQTLFIDSRIPHQTLAETDPCAYILLQFSPEDFEPGNRQGKNFARYLYGISHQQEQSVRLIEDSEITRVICAMWDEYTEKKEGAGKFILSHLYYLMGWLERKGYLSAQSPFDEQAIQKLAPVLEYIDQNYGKQELSLETVSHVLGLNPAYFCRTFKRATGHGFTEYLNNVRIAKSEALLRDTSLSILDISLEVGFSSVSYFNRVFKKIKNCTPSVYRSAQYSAM